MKSTMDPTARRAAVGEMTLAGASVNKIARTLGICRSAVLRHRHALGLCNRTDIRSGGRHDEVERLTREGLEVAEIAERLNYTDARVYQIQTARGLRTTGEPTEAQVRGYVKRSKRIVEVAAMRNRTGVRCSHCGAPADPENRMMKRDWCDTCLNTNTPDVDPNYEANQRAEMLDGRSRSSVISEAELWAPGRYSGGGNLARQAVKAARRIGAVRAPVRGAALSLDEQRASADRMREAYRAERMANLAPFGRRDGREAGR